VEIVELSLEASKQNVVVAKTFFFEHQKKEVCQGLENKNMVSQRYE